MRYRIPLYLIIFFTLYACSDVVIDDLSEENIIILSPPDNYTSTEIAITFWWEELKGVEKYNLQIVKESFSLIEKLIIDTTVIKNKLTYTLASDKYQWRVKALNDGSETAYTTYTLTIDSTGSISQQQVVLIAPDDNYLTNKTFITFKWEEVTGADEYRIQIADPDFSSNYTLIVDANSAADSIAYADLPEGTYQWRVRAQSSEGNTNYSTPRTYIIDTAAPAAPQLVLPTDGDTLTVPDTLTWTIDSFSDSDTLYISDDALFSVHLVRQNISSTNYIYSDTTKGSYYWRLRSVDKAGNISGYSDIRKFIVD